MPGSALYVVDLDTGRIDTPALVPQRRADARHEVVYGHAWKVAPKSRPDGRQVIIPE